MKRSVSLVLSLALALCLGITMISADFTPSAESKDVPEIVAPEVDGEELPDNVSPEDVVAVIVNPEDKVYVVESALSIISVSDAKNYISDADGESHDEGLLDRCQELIDAYDFVDEKGVAASVAGIDGMAELLGIEFPKYTVPYIFELSVDDDEASGALNAEESYITVVFDVSSFANEDSKLAVAHIVDEKWVLVPLENTILDAEKGTLTVSFDSLCPVMFISVEESDETGSETETSCAGSETESESGTETGSETAGESADTESVETESVETEESVTVPVVTNPVETDPTDTETKPTQTTEPEDSESESETKPDGDDDDDAAMIIVIVCCVVAVIGACAIAFFVLYKKGIIAKWTKKSDNSDKSNKPNGSRKSKKKKSKWKKKKNKKYRRP